MNFRLNSKALPWLIASMASILFAFSSVCAQEVPTLDQTYRKDMGEPRFDSNAVTRYQVNETNGNLYLYHHLMTIPNQRGLPLDVYLTYNSKNFDSPHILGKACWSLSLEKRLNEETFYLVEDPGDWEELEAGDLLKEEPDENFDSIIKDLDEQIVLLSPGFQELNREKVELEMDISEGWTDVQNFPIIMEGLDFAIDEARKELPVVEQDIWDISWNIQTLEVNKNIWDELNAQKNCERDGWDRDANGNLLYYMPDDDWNKYQNLGGNAGFNGHDELDDAYEDLSYSESQRGALEKSITDMQSQETIEITNRTYLVDEWLPAQEALLGELEGDILDASSELGDYEDAISYYDDFENGGFTPVDGSTYVDGEGDGFFILEDFYDPTSNALHVDIDTNSNWSPSTATFKDGRVYVFSSDSDGRILAARDRYGNENTYYYASIDGKNCLSAVQDNVGRRVELTYDGDKISEIDIKYEDQTREFILGYDGENNLTSITNPENQTTQFEYYPPEAYQPPAVFRARPLKISRHLISKVIDARENTIHFEYNDPTFRCTRIWKQDEEENIARDTSYEWISGPQDGQHPSVLVTDSRGNILTKYFHKLELDASTGRMERTLITRIDDPYGESTQYGFDSYYFNLTKTTDTNGLIHDMGYDGMGNLVRQVADPEGNAFETSFTYETRFNQVISSTDANLHTKYNFYVTNGEPSGHGPDGVLWKETDAEGNETFHWYNQYGQRIKTQDARAKITEFEYDNPWGYLSRIRKYTDYPSTYFDKTFTYDCFGNKLSETDFNENLTEYGYDVMNRLTNEDVHDGETEFVTTYYYDAVGNRTGMVNPRGVFTQYDYDGFDRLITVTEALGRPEERSKHYGYDTEDNKNSETDPNGNVTTFSHDALNRLIKQVESAGILGNKVTRYYYDGLGDSSTNGGTHQYDRSKDRYTQMVSNNKCYRGEERWLITDYKYDFLYRLAKVVDPKGFDTEYYYDPVGNKLWEEDANNHRTNYEYYADNRLKKVVDPYTRYVQYWYDPVGNKREERDKNDHHTFYEYDALNRLTMTTDAEAGEAYALYDGMNKVAERDKNGNWTAFSYNGRNLLTETHSAISGIVSYADYDEAGNKVSETDPNGNVTRFEYDGLNRMTAKIQAYGTLDLETGYAYDDNGNRTSIEDAEGNITYYEYDDLNRLIKVEDPINGAIHPTIYDYDLQGNKVRTTDARWKETEYFYDVLNRLIKTRNALKITTATYDYDGVGNRLYQIDAKNQRIDYDYDYLNRLKLRTFVGASSWVEYSYDSAGNRLQMVDSTGTTSYACDDINRVISVTSPGPAGSKTIGYSYYPNGERETMTDPDSGVTHYYYDDLNRLERIVDPDDGETTYEYDLGSRLIEMTYPSGAVAHYDVYDQADRLVHLKSTDSSGNTTFTEFTYVYDRVGNRKEMIEAAGTTHYEYDDLYRLTLASYPNSTAASYYYDAVGNRTLEINNGVSKNYDYNDLNQLISWSSGGTGTPTKLIDVTGWVADSDLEEVTVNGVLASLNQQTFTAEGVKLTVGTNVLTAKAPDAAGNVSQHQINVSYEPNLASLVLYEYDLNGCLQEKTVDGSVVTTYEYDFENRLTLINLPTYQHVSFIYDGDKRRVSRKDGDGRETWFLQDGLNVLQDLATDGTPWASYVQGIGIDKLISRKSAGNRVYYHCDAIGSVRSLTNEAESQVGTYAFDAWGKITLETGTTGNDYKFTSREWEDDLGLQFNRARFYDPEIGRFISPDPLTGGPDDPTICYLSNIYAIFHRLIKEHVASLEPHKNSRYIYCYNNPVNRIDPLGLNGDDPNKIETKPPEPAPPPAPPTQTPPPGSSSTPDTSDPGETAKEVEQGESVDPEHQNGDSTTTQTEVGKNTRTDAQRFRDDLVRISQDKNKWWKGPDVMQRLLAANEIANRYISEFFPRVAVGGALFGGHTLRKIPSIPSGFRSKLTQGGQDKGVYRHVAASAAAVLQGTTFISRAQDFIDRRQPIDQGHPQAQKEAELAGNQAGREVGEAIGNYLNEEMSEPQLAEQLNKILTP